MDTLDQGLDDLDGAHLSPFSSPVNWETTLQRRPFGSNALVSQDFDELKVS